MFFSEELPLSKLKHSAGAISFICHILHLDCPPNGVINYSGGVGQEWAS